MKKKLFLLLLVVFVNSHLLNAQFWSEDFSSYSSNTGIDGTGNIGDYPAGVTKWTLDASNATLSDESDYIKVKYGKLEGRDIDGYVIFQTESIDISAYAGGITFNLDASESGSMESSDYFDVYYQLDGGSFTMISNWNGQGSSTHTLIDDFSSATITKSLSQANTLVIKVVIANNTSSEYHRLDNIEISGNMAYSSSSCSQNTQKVAPGRSDNNIIAIAIETAGTQNPISLSSFKINANGTDGTLSSKIENAKIFYTGGENVFSTDTQFGSTFASPTVSDFDINGSQVLSEGTNYFWVSFDTKAGANIGEVIDAECISFVLDGQTNSPTPTAPAGNRLLANSLSGDYTIGSSGDYSSFNAAFDDLSSLGIGAVVTFLVESGIYTEQINLSAIYGTSATDTIVVKSASGNRADVLLKFEPTLSTSNYVIDFNGTDYMTWKDIRIQNTGTSNYGVVLCFEGQNNNINLLDCNIIGRDANTDGDEDYNCVTGKNGTTNLSTNIYFENDSILYGSKGINLLGGNSTNFETGNQISNCVIHDFSYCGIFTNYQDSIVIRQNDIRSASSYDYQYGIYAYRAQNGYQIIGNKVYLDGEENNVGLYLIDCHASSSSYASIFNNYLSLEVTDGSVAIRIQECNYHKIYHNSINIQASKKSGKGSKNYEKTGMQIEYGWDDPSYGNLDIRNNVAYTEALGITVSQTAVDNNYIEMCDRNVWYNTATTFGEWGSTACTTFSDWQSTSGLDSQSAWDDPSFYSDESPSVTNSAIKETVPQLYEITMDIDEMPRRSMVTPGARNFGSVWTGATDDDWNNSNNWIPSVVPGATDDIYLSWNSTYSPSFSTDVDFRDLSGEGTITCNGKVATTYGNVKFLKITFTDDELMQFGGLQNTSFTSGGNSFSEVIIDKDNAKVQLEDNLTTDVLRVDDGELDAHHFILEVKGNADLSGGSVSDLEVMKLSGITNSTFKSGANTFSEVVIEKDMAAVELEDDLITVGLKIDDGELDVSLHELKIEGNADFSGGSLSNPRKLTFIGNNNSTFTSGGNSFSEVVIDKDNAAVELEDDLDTRVLRIEEGELDVHHFDLEIKEDVDFSGGTLSNSEKIEFTGMTNSTFKSGANTFSEIVIDKDMAAVELENDLITVDLKIDDGELDVSLHELKIDGDADFSGGSLSNPGKLTFIGNNNSTFTSGSNSFSEVVIDKDNAAVELEDDLDTRVLRIEEGELDVHHFDLEIKEDVDFSGGTLSNSEKIEFTGDSNSEITSGGNFMKSVVVDKDGNEVVTLQDALTAALLRVSHGKMKADHNVETTGKIIVGSSSAGQGSLEITAEKVVIANDTVIIEDTGVLKQKANGEKVSKLIPKKEIVKKNGGTYIVEKYYQGGEWHLISPTISDATADIFNGRYLQYFTELDNQWTYVPNANYQLEVMHGYSVWSTLSGDDFLEFMGNPNSGAQSFNFSYGGATPLADYGWNLIGNPYTSTLDWDQVTIPTNLDATIYLFDPSIGTNGDYVYYLNGSGSNTCTQYVALGQGFMVHCNNSFGGTLNFSGDEIVAVETTFYKSKDEIVNSLVISVNGCKSSKSEIRFIEDATPNFDAHYDVYRLIGESEDIPYIYSKTPVGKLAVNTLPDINQYKLIPLGFELGVSGQNTFDFSGMDSFDPQTPIFLEDKKTNHFINLREEESYTFTYELNERTDRFVIHFANIEENEEGEISIYSSGNQIYISGELGSNAKVNVYNNLGQMVYSQEVSENSTLQIDKTGNYIVQLISDEKSFSKKIFIQ